LSVLVAVANLRLDHRNRTDVIEASFQSIRPLSEAHDFSPTYLRFRLHHFFSFYNLPGRVNVHRAPCARYSWQLGSLLKPQPAQMAHPNELDLVCIEPSQ